MDVSESSAEIPYDMSPPHRLLHHSDLSSYIDWSSGEGNFRKFASANQKHYQIWVVTCHQYGISVPVAQMSFCGETSVEAFEDLVGVASNCFMGTLTLFCSLLYKKIGLHGGDLDGNAS